MGTLYDFNKFVPEYQGKSRLSQPELPLTAQAEKELRDKYNLNKDFLSPANSHSKERV